MPVSESGRLRVVVIDSQDLFSRSLEMALPSASGHRIEVVGTAATVEGAEALFGAVDPDVALVDLGLPAPGALELVRRVRAEPSKLRLIGVTDDSELDVAADALAYGVDSLVTKGARPENLLAPILAVLQGWRVLSAPLLEGLLFRARRPGAEIVDELDDATIRLWLLVAEGLELSRIAEQLYVSERTAKRMVSDLRDRLGVTTRIQMAALAGRVGLLDEAWAIDVSAGEGSGRAQSNGSTNSR